ncbi:phage holin family protein [Shouchella lonarensis]|uniref:Toxin secretion/phage lysis holin n=1 Tax=Shouchella lonarensis TaxID=1464122 RepID=A0A1G6GH90_9BACI|nr:phage holin family protein [Shouchella lonarensis]SDB81259.1 toxin secretion/phage lysis holin [Shouchella lonarensis]
MEKLLSFFAAENFEVAQLYLFGGVKFLDLLLLVMALDIVTGVIKAIKKGELQSKQSLLGYSRKLLVLVVIVLANVIDQVLDMGGAITYATVVFYICTEGLSILENLAEMGVAIPTKLAKKLKVMQPDSKDEGMG